MMDFQTADQRYAELQQRYQSGDLSSEAFDRELKKMVVRAEGRIWAKSRQTGAWQYFDGRSWVAGAPAGSGPSPALAGTTSQAAAQAPPAPSPRWDSGSTTGTPAYAGASPFTGSAPSGVVTAPAAPAAGPAVSAGDLVGFGPRFAAYLIDAAAVGIGGLILAAILNHVAQGLGLVVLLAGIGYFPYFWSTSGQTLGMQVMHIKVVRLDRQPLSAGTGIVRYLGYVLSVIALYLGLLWVLWDPQKQGWHDKMAGTVVVRAN